MWGIGPCPGICFPLLTGALATALDMVVGYIVIPAH